MTRLDELAAGRIALNPDAPQPPFPLWMGLPGDWSLLDTHPGSWRRSVDDLLDTTFRGSRLPARERREIIEFFEQLVADCQRSGAALSLIAVGRREAGGAASVGVHLAFGDEGRPSSLARVRDMLPRSGTTTEVDSGVGPALLQRDRMTMIPPGATEVVALTSLQIFIPIPGTNWTAILATATAFPELTAPMEDLLRRIAAELRLTEEPWTAPDEADLEAERPIADTDYLPAPVRKGPGIERGFGTLVPYSLVPKDLVTRRVEGTGPDQP